MSKSGLLPVDDDLMMITTVSRGIFGGPPAALDAPVRISDLPFPKAYMGTAQREKGYEDEVRRNEEANANMRYLHMRSHEAHPWLPDDPEDLSWLQAIRLFWQMPTA